MHRPEISKESRVEHAVKAETWQEQTLEEVFEVKTSCLRALDRQHVKHVKLNPEVQIAMTSRSPAIKPMMLKPSSSTKPDQLLLIYNIEDDLTPLAEKMS